jgi:hypothetical protein
MLNPEVCEYFRFARQFHLVVDSVVEILFRSSHKFQGRRIVISRPAAPYSRWHECPRFFAIFSGFLFRSSVETRWRPISGTEPPRLLRLFSDFGLPRNVAPEIPFNALPPLSTDGHQALRRYPMAPHRRYVARARYG